MSDEENAQESGSDASPVQVARRRTGKRKGSPRKAYSQRRTKVVAQDNEAMVNVVVPSTPLPQAPVSQPIHAQPAMFEPATRGATFVPLTTLPTLYQSPVVNSTQHVPLQHIATSAAAGTHMSTLSLLNSLQDDKLALILPILVRMENKIDQIMAMIGTRPNFVAAGQTINPVNHLVGQTNAMMGSQLNMPTIGSQPNINMGSHTNPSVTGIQTNGPVPENTANSLAWTQTNSTMTGNHLNASMMQTQLNTQVAGSSASVVGTHLNVQVPGSQSNTSVVGSQSNATMETQSRVETVANQSSTPMEGTPENGHVAGSQSNVAMTVPQSSVTENSLLLRNESKVLPQANASGANGVDTLVMGTQSDISNVVAQRQDTTIVPHANAKAIIEEIRLLIGQDFPASPEEIYALKAGANSSMNFAVRVMRRIFLHNELVGRNVAGVRGKERVEASRVNAIKEIVFIVYQIPPLEKETVWKNCHKAMDSYLRKLHLGATKL